MPRVYRSMKGNGGRPAVGITAMMLGVRASDIPQDQDRNVRPGTGGLSVSSALRAMPARLVPRRLQHLVPGAAGNSNLYVWVMGQGDFVDGGVADHLHLRVDPLDNTHGFIEPNGIMSIDAYNVALAATRDSWATDET
jgi:hypothetical protein